MILLLLLACVTCKLELSADSFANGSAVRCPDVTKLKQYDNDKILHSNWVKLPVVEQR